MPILAPLVPILERLAVGDQPEDRPLTGARGGVLTTAALRDATDWDHVVPEVARHGLRHTGATWMADARVPLLRPSMRPRG